MACRYCKKFQGYALRFGQRPNEGPSPIKNDTVPARHSHAAHQGGEAAQNSFILQRRSDGRDHFVNRLHFVDHVFILIERQRLSAVR